jgi:hypothetical protein
MNNLTLHAQGLIHLAYEEECVSTYLGVLHKLTTSDRFASTAQFFFFFFFFERSMSTNSSDVLPNKRKRYQFEIPSLTIEANVGDLLTLANRFCATVNTVVEGDFENVGKKLLATEAVPGQIMLFPTDKEEEGEQIDDKWAMTSNWVYFTVLSVGAPAMIKLIGTVFPTTSVPFREGHTTRVHLPEYLIQAVGSTELEGRAYLNEDTSMETQGEEEPAALLGKRVLLYGIPDLDKQPRLCSLRNEGIKRMVKVTGMIRLMGMDRFERMVVDLLYCKKDFALAVPRYAASAV